jgi:hypothetical protein
VRCFTGAMQCQFLAHHSLSLAFVCANQYSDRLGSQVCGAVRQTSCVHVSFALTTTAWLCIRELCTEAEVIPPIPGCPKVFLALVTSSSMLNQSIRIIRVLCNTHTHTLSLFLFVVYRELLIGTRSQDSTNHRSMGYWLVRINLSPRPWKHFKALHQRTIGMLCCIVHHHAMPITIADHRAVEPNTCWHCRMSEPAKAESEPSRATFLRSLYHSFRRQRSTSTLILHW